MLQCWEDVLNYGLKINIEGTVAMMISRTHSATNT